MTMLNGTLMVHGVNVEELATDVCDRWCARNRSQGSYIEDSRKDDLKAYLIAECWRISLAYDPARSQRFRGYAYSLLTFRCTDWLRKDEGRTVWKWKDTEYQRERPEVWSLDIVFGGADFDEPGSRGRDVSLGELVGDRAGGDAADRAADVARLEDQRDRRRDRDFDVIRQAADRRVA